jgi:hypothetical protein
MTRLPQGLTRSQPLAESATRRGREFTQAIRREKEQQLAGFRSMMAASRKYGPAAAKPMPRAAARRSLSEVFGPNLSHMSDRAITHAVRRIMGK